MQVPKEWITTTIGEIVTFYSGSTPSMQNGTFWGGVHPWITAKDLKKHYLENSIVTLSDHGFAFAKKAPKGASLILVRGMTLLKDFPVGYASRPMAFNQDVKALVPLGGIDGLFLSFFLVSQKDNIRQFVSTASHGTGKLDTEIIKGLEINLPSFPEQQKIAQMLSTWDKTIEKLDALISAKQKRKKGLMQKLLTGKKRFSGFGEEWKEIRLKKVIKEEKSRNKGSTIIRVLSVTNRNGFVLPEEQFSRQVASSDLSNYKIVRKGQFGYNPSRINVGSFARLDTFSEGVLSPMYVVFSIDEKNLDTNFFFNWMDSHEAKQRIISSIQGTVRDSVGFDALSSFLIKLPSIYEQQKIAAVLTAAEKEIGTHQKQLAALKEQKKGLMQQLLTGKKRVIVRDAA